MFLIDLMSHNKRKFEPHFWLLAIKIFKANVSQQREQQVQMPWGFEDQQGSWKGSQSATFPVTYSLTDYNFPNDGFQNLFVYPMRSTQGFAN